MAATWDKQAVDLAARLRAAVGPLERRLRQQATEPLTPTQLSVLGAIYRHGPVPLNVLASLEQLSPPTVSKAVASLERAEIIVRIWDPDDRRICRVAVTDAGNQWIQAGRAQRNSWLAERMSRLSMKDRATLAEAVPVLEKLLAEDD